MTSAASDTIAVFGGTGKQGRSVIDALRDRGAHIRALVRDAKSERARELAGRGVELAQIDIHDRDSLTAALRGVSASFFMTTPAGFTASDAENEVHQGIALVNAASVVSVPRVVLSSVGGAERHSGVPHFESKRRVEMHLAQSKLQATVVRPTAFMENFEFMAPSIEAGELVLRMPLPDGIPLQMVAVRDIGRISAALLLGSVEVPGGAVEIAGDERTGSEIAAAFGDSIGLPSRYEALPLDVLGDNEDGRAMFRWFAESSAYQADIEAVQSIDPQILDLPGWLRFTGWTVNELTR